MDEDMLNYYQKKMKDSFRTYFTLILFEFIIHEKEEDLFKICGDEFIMISLDASTKDRYVHEYWQELKWGKIKEAPIKHIMDRMDSWNKNSMKFDMKNKEQLNIFESSYVRRFESLFSKEKFERLYNIQECAYCGVSEKDIIQLAENNMIFKKNERGWSLEIDRKDSNEEYSPENCVRCCYWCNNAKTDEFNEDEFSVIAEGIRRVWVKRGIDRLSKS